MKNKNPLIIASSLLGLTLAASSFAAITLPSSATPTGQVMENGKWEQGHPNGWNKKGEPNGMKGGMGMGKGMKGGMGGRGMQELNLTAAQKAQLEQMHTANKAKMEQFKAQLNQIDTNIATQKAAGASTSTLLGLYQQKQAIMDQFFAMHQQQRQQFVSILTPEQQLKMYESQNRGHGEHGGDRDGMRKPPMPAGTAQK